MVVVEHVIAASTVQVRAYVTPLSLVKLGTCVLSTDRERIFKTVITLACASYSTAEFIENSVAINSHTAETEALISEKRRSFAENDRLNLDFAAAKRSPNWLDSLFLELQLQFDNSRNVIDLKPMGT